MQTEDIIDGQLALLNAIVVSGNTTCGGNAGSYIMVVCGTTTKADKGPLRYMKHPPHRCVIPYAESTTKHINCTFISASLPRTLHMTRPETLANPNELSVNQTDSLQQLAHIHSKPSK
jgi:hypothetical protein